jgi:hypothetical protein
MGKVLPESSERESEDYDSRAVRMYGCNLWERVQSVATWVTRPEDAGGRGNRRNTPERFDHGTRAAIEHAAARSKSAVQRRLFAPSHVARRKAAQSRRRALDCRAIPPECRRRQKVSPA